jgi:hypothetical protein
MIKNQQVLRRGVPQLDYFNTQMHLRGGQVQRGEEVQIANAS